MPAELSAEFTWDAAAITQTVIGHDFASAQAVKAENLLGKTLGIIGALNYEITPGSLRRVVPPRCEWKTDSGCAVLTPILKTDDSPNLAPKLLLQRIVPAAARLTWQDHGSGAPIPGAAWAVDATVADASLVQGSQTWRSVFGDYVQADYLAAGTYQTTGWASGAPKRYDHFTAKVFGHRSNESFGYGPPLVAVLMAGEGAQAAGQLPLLAAPSSFALVGRINKTKTTTPLYLWRPLPPPGYASLGDLATNTSTLSPQRAAAVRVVRKDCTTPCGAAFATWFVTPKKNAGPPLSLWGARPRPGSGDTSGGQFLASDVSVTTEDEPLKPPEPPQLLCLAAKCIAAAGQSPEQVHLAPSGADKNGDATSMLISWTTDRATPTTECIWSAGKGGALDERTAGSAVAHRPAFDRVEFLHTVTLTGLRYAQDASYSYRCGSLAGGTLSPVASFTTDAAAPVVAWLGDTGNHPVWHTRTVPAIGQLVASGSANAFVHVGDMAYYSAVDGGTVGDQFMRDLHRATLGKVPMMVIPGNGDVFSCGADGKATCGCTCDFTTRFKMPCPASSKDCVSPFWSSWAIGPARFIGLDSEAVFWCSSVQNNTKQLAFLKQELAAANTPAARKRQPWLVAMIHRPLWTSQKGAGPSCNTTEQSTLRATYEKLLHEGGVDIVLTGHNHMYERTWPVYNGTVLNGSTDEPYAPLDQPERPQE